MMAAKPHPNLVLMRRYEDAWLRGDVEEAMGFYADGCALHHFGRNPLAGDYVGREAIRGYIDRMLATADKCLTLEVYDVLASDTHAVGIIRVRFEREGRKPLEGKRVTVFEIGADAKIHDIWVRDEDQYAVDEFWS